MVAHDVGSHCSVTTPGVSDVLDAVWPTRDLAQWYSDTPTHSPPKSARRFGHGVNFRENFCSSQLCVFVPFIQCSHLRATSKGFT